MAPRTRSNRRRGVRASRARLYHALTEAGFRSQTALAERIADLEGLDQAPRDLVSRVFREQPVELQTLERVARALDVEAWQLYLTSGEPERAEDAVRTDARPIGPAATPGPSARRSSTRVRALAAAVTGAVVIVGVTWWSGAIDDDPGANDPRDALAPVWTTAFPIGRTPTLVVRATPDDTFADALRGALEQHFRVAAPSAELLVHASDPRDITERLRSDAVVEGDVVHLGRLTGLRVFMFGSAGIQQQVWSETVPTTQLDARLEAVADNAARAVAHALGMPVAATGGTPHYPLAPVQDYYLEGRMHLDGPSSELNIRRAQSRFEAALRLDANYADAHAGLCEALLAEYWMEEAQRALNDARLACARAMQLAPDAPATRIAHAHYLRVTGALDEAVAVLDELLEAHPGDPATLVELAATLLQVFRSDGDAEALARAQAAAHTASDAEPAFWQPPFWLASLAYFSGDLPGAIAAAEEARARDENEYVLANLGTFYFCAEDLERARATYERARIIAPHSYVGDEFLGTLNYLLGDYDTAATLREQAVERLRSVGEPEIHEMWGNLADAYLGSGQHDSAIEAFERAAEIAERDVLQGIETPADRASRAYYYTMLASLAPDRLPDDAAVQIKGDLKAALEHTLDPGAAVRTAKAWMQHDRPELALQAFEQAVERCGGFAHTPGLAALRPALASE